MVKHNGEGAVLQPLPSRPVLLGVPTGREELSDWWKKTPDFSRRNCALNAGSRPAQVLAQAE